MQLDTCTLVRAASCFTAFRLQRNLSETTAQGTFKTWSPLPGGFLIQGHLTGNSTPWSWLQWSSGTGGRLIRVVALTGFIECAIQARMHGYSRELVQATSFAHRVGFHQAQLFVYLIQSGPTRVLQVAKMKVQQALLILKP